MTKTYWYTLFFLSAFLGEINAQNPVTNFSYQNPFYFNPAMAGIDKKRKLTLNYSVGVNEKYGLFSYEHPSKNLNQNIGLFFKASLDDGWAVNNIGLAYNYTFKLTELSTLSSGFQFNQYYVARESSANLIGRDWQLYPNMDFGLVFTFKEIKVGASLFNIWRATSQFNNRGLQIEVPPFVQSKILNISFAYDFKIRKNFEAGLSFLHSKLIEDDRIVDFSGQITFYKFLTFGAISRLQEEEISSKIFFGIRAADYLMFHISFGLRKERYNAPRNIELILQCNL